MKITEVESFVVRIPVAASFRDSVNMVEAFEFPGVVIRTDSELEGTGFTLTLGTGGDPIQTTIDKIYAPLLVGADPGPIHFLYERLYAKSRWTGRGGVTQMALAAVDIALWDLKAKALGVPLWQLIGGHKPDGAVKAYNTSGGWLNYEIPELIAQTRAYVDAGWDAVKLKVGRERPIEDLRRVAAVRDALSDDIDMMIDVNGGWDLPTALLWAPRYDEFGLLWIEEPLDADDVAGHERLAAATRTPLAHGELLYSCTAFREFIDRGCIGWVQADVTRLGVTEFLAVAELAAAHNLPVVPHAADHSRVHRHFGVGHRACPLVEWVDHLEVQAAFEDPMVLENGVFHLSNAPGASTTFAADAFERFRTS
jgi:L-alanine-DL-glutamate epimerase-like enolase superfamily enzyme